MPLKTPDISLLKRPITENMVALYLLDLARDKLANPELAAQIHAQILAAANEEYATAKGEPGAVLPSNVADRLDALRVVLAK